MQRYRQAAVYWHAAGYGEDEERAPIRAEHFGITTVEAMAAGCVPVVVARGGQPELVTHGVDGFLWQTLDELGACTLALLRDKDLRQTMAAAARQSARRFDPAEFATTLSRTLAAAHIPAISMGDTATTTRIGAWPSYDACTVALQCFNDSAAARPHHRSSGRSPDRSSCCEHRGAQPRRPPPPLPAARAPGAADCA